MISWKKRDLRFNVELIELINNKNKTVLILVGGKKWTSLLNK